MSKWAMLGGLCWVISGVLVLFQIIGNMIKENYNWQMMSIVDVVESQYLDWIDKIDINLARQALDYIVTMPLYLLLLVVGGICFLFSIFYKGR